MTRIYLSPPHLSGSEAGRLAAALESNWIAPLGPEVDAFERELAVTTGVGHAAALSSGTAALHLALHLAGVGPGDEVLCSDLTFVASANAIVYLGARPVFVDADPSSWNVDVHLLLQELEERASAGRVPRALVVTDLYGQCAGFEAFLPRARELGVAVIEDAAESLGATRGGRPAGGLADLGVLSFNGNKIITTSGGGALLCDDRATVERARFLASQARDPAPHYEHSELGYNYRLSNLLAAVGRAQLAVLGARVAARRRNFSAYLERLGDLPGIEFMPECPGGRATRWLTCLTIDPAAFGTDREEVRRQLEAEDIEARPVWKPMHLQPLYDGCRVVGGAVVERLFRDGLCLPSGSELSRTDLERVTGIVRACCTATGEGG